jgi:hypothetical protein
MMQTVVLVLTRMYLGVALLGLRGSSALAMHSWNAWRICRRARGTSRKLVCLDRAHVIEGS